MRELKMVCLAALLLISFVLIGCSGGNLHKSDRRQYIQDNWGRSVATLQHRQTLNPEAGLTAEPVVGLDGRAADYSINKYRETFKKEVDQAEQLVIQFGD